MMLNRGLCAIVAGGLVTSACASARPLLRRQQCYNADVQLADALAPFEAARAAGCPDTVASGAGANRTGVSRTGPDCIQLRLEIERLSVICPNHAPTLMANAIIAYDEHQPVTSQQYLDQVFMLSPSYPDAAVLRARIAIEQGNLPFARRLLEQQIKLAPVHAGLHETYGAALYLGGWFPEARVALAMARSLGAPGWRVAYHLGLVEEASGQLEQAQRYYTEALEGNPEWAPAQARLKALRLRGGGTPQ